MATGIKNVGIEVDIYNDLGAFWNEVVLINVIIHHSMCYPCSDDDDTDNTRQT